MVIVPEVRVSVDERALTARVEVSLPSRMSPLSFTVDPARDGHGWEIREPLAGALGGGGRGGPLGGALAWGDSFETAVGVAGAAANGALGSDRRSSLP